MGVDFRAVLVLGFPIHDFDLWVEVGIKPLCPQGHEQTGKDPYCSKCGGKFGGSTKKAPSKGFAKLCEDTGINPEHIYSNEGLGVFVVTEAHGHGTPENASEVMGFKLAHTHSHRVASGGVCLVKMGELAPMVEDLRAAQRALGLGRTRDIDLYLSLEYG